MGIFWNVKWPLAAAAAMALAGCSTLPGEQASGPALWKAADEDTTVYLFGTIHLLPEGHVWRTPSIDAAIARSDELVIETLIGDDPQASARTMMRLGVTPGLPPLAERVPENKRDRLNAMIAESGVPAAVLDRMETWAAALTLAAVSFREMKLDPELGVERGLNSLYRADDKPISGLETVEQQMGFFDGLSEEAQRDFLAGVLEDPAAAREQFMAMMEAWISGDVKAIARTFDTELKASPELWETLLRDRNARWAEWIDERLDRPGTVFLAVGAGHLAGKSSVQAMLDKRGIETERVRR